MPYIPPEVVEQARQIDLLTYLRKLEPDNVEEVKGTRNVYTVRNALLNNMIVNATIKKVLYYPFTVLIFFRQTQYLADRPFNLSEKA